MPIKKIVYCTDFSDNAELAFLSAIETAKRYNAHLDLIHVLPPVVNPLLTETDWISPYEPLHSFVSKIEEKMYKEYGTRINENIDYNFVVLDGHVSTEILQYLEDNHTDLVIMGSYGLTGVGLVLFGSIAKRIAHKAPCSVMIVREPDKNQNQTDESEAKDQD